MDRAYYIAQQADAMAKRRYSQARSKPQIQREDLAALDALVTPLIKKGQPLTHIYAEHGAELPVSQRTLYNYIDSGKLSVGNLDLRRKVGYRPRKKKKEQTISDEVIAIMSKSMAAAIDKAVDDLLKTTFK